MRSCTWSPLWRKRGGEKTSPFWRETQARGPLKKTIRRRPRRPTRWAAPQLPHIHPEPRYTGTVSCPYPSHSPHLALLPLQFRGAHADVQRTRVNTPATEGVDIPLRLFGWATAPDTRLVKRLKRMGQGNSNICGVACAPSGVCSCESDRHHLCKECMVRALTSSTQSLVLPKHQSLSCARCGEPQPSRL